MNTTRDLPQQIRKSGKRRKPVGKWIQTSAKRSFTDDQYEYPRTGIIAPDGQLPPGSQCFLTGRREDAYGIMTGAVYPYLSTTTYTRGSMGLSTCPSRLPRPLPRQGRPPLHEAGSYLRSKNWSMYTQADCACHPLDSHQS